MASRIKTLKFDNGAGAINSRSAAGETYLFSTTKSNELVDFFGKLLYGPVRKNELATLTAEKSRMPEFFGKFLPWTFRREAELMPLKKGERALIVKHSSLIVNYYVYEKLPHMEAKKVIGELGIA